MTLQDDREPKDYYVLVYSQCVVAGDGQPWIPHPTLSLNIGVCAHMCQVPDSGGVCRSHCSSFRTVL